MCRHPSGQWPCTSHALVYNIALQNKSEPQPEHSHRAILQSVARPQVELQIRCYINAGCQLETPEGFHPVFVLQQPSKPVMRSDKKTSDAKIIIHPAERTLEHDAGCRSHFRVIHVAIPGQSNHSEQAIIAGDILLTADNQTPSALLIVIFTPSGPGNITDDAALRHARDFEMPGFFWGNIMRVAALGLLGKNDEARLEYDKLLKLKPDFASDCRNYIEVFVLDDNLVSRMLEGIHAVDSKNRQ